MKNEIDFINKSDGVIYRIHKSNRKIYFKDEYNNTIAIGEYMANMYILSIVNNTNVPVKVLYSRIYEDIKIGYESANRDIEENISKSLTEIDKHFRKTMSSIIYNDRTESFERNPLSLTDDIYYRLYLFEAAMLEPDEIIQHIKKGPCVYYSDLMVSIILDFRKRKCVSLEGSGEDELYKEFISIDNFYNEVERVNRIFDLTWDDFKVIFKRCFKYTINELEDICNNKKVLN